MVVKRFAIAKATLFSAPDYPVKRGEASARLFWKGLVGKCSKILSVRGVDELQDGDFDHG